MATTAQTMLAEDVEIVHRVLAHIDAGTTDTGDVWREPVENYVESARYAAELRMLRSTPSVFVPSAAVPNAGDYVERVAFGVPIFAVRGRDRRVRVFRNSCRHRGMSLVEGRGCSQALVCRYHGWTYRLDGSLAHVPHADGFPDLHMPSRGLVEVASREIGGLVVIDGLDSHATTAVMAALTDGSPWRDKLPAARRLVFAESAVRAINWKVLVEQFLEGYHIRSTHRDTFFPLQYDNLNIVERFGPNSRITLPYRNIERLRNRPESTWTVDRRVTFVYHLFPNVMLATFPNQVIMVVIDPIDIDHSATSTYAMADQVPDRDGAPSLIDRGAFEDNAMSAAVQRGLHAGANPFVEFGQHESAIGHFHANLEERLGALPNG
ncbi:MAG: aromatic ring-hydroxylating oxygenase subunit alpha [Ilumatobacteraceae bacterium]